jgi:GNAT superfamily N-acetyltransferase
MARRLTPLTGDVVERLPAPCQTCLYWERGEAAPSLTGSNGHDDPASLVRKQAWVSAQVQQGWPPGRLAMVDGRLAGYALFAPSREFAPRGPLAPRPSPDALQLATVWVTPDLRGQGLGRLLLQSAIREAIRLDLEAVEVYADRRWRERSCVLPATWLLREGFEVHREAPRIPLLRLETKRTARWAESLEAALEGLRLHLPRPAPARVPEQVSRSGPPELDDEVRRR